MLDDNTKHDTVEIRGNFKWGHTPTIIVEKKTVQLFIQEPNSYVHTGEWRAIATVESKEKFAIFQVPRSHFTKPGRYRITMVVLEDKSCAIGNIWVLNKGTEAVVYDIDGTLTTGDNQVVTEMLLDAAHVGYNPTLRNGSVTMVRTWYAKGYLPIYLSGRAGTFYNLTRDWLKKRGFPPGIIGHTESTMPTLPLFKIPGTNVGVGTFKANFLQRFIDGGIKLTSGYGNTSNDIKVYESLHIPKERTFMAKMIGPSSVYKDTVAVGQSFVKSHVEFLQQLKEANIPIPRESFDLP